VVDEGLREYLTAAGAPRWHSDAASDADMLVEAAGRLCYRSWAPGLNPNVTKVREGNRDYVGNILRQRHGSVLEHASATFAFTGVSRVFTHELVRHRAGCAVSQESLRYVRLDEIPFWFPPSLRGDLEVVARGNALLRAMESFQKYMSERFKLDEPGVDFSVKKLLTSAMRRFAPIGLSTAILWTANLRALRHVVELRTALGAEEEIRAVFDQVARIASSRYPAAFQDFTRSGLGEWAPASSKV